MKRYVSIIFLLLLFSCISVFSFSADTLLQINIDKTIEPGLASYVERSYQVAEEEGYSGVLIVMDTPGGRIDASLRIKNAIIRSSLPTYTYVDGQAISAGSLIALSSDVIGMRRGSTIGAAEPRIGQEIADEKVMSVWKEELASAAEIHGRDTEIAKAFADREMEIPGVTTQGQILSLTSSLAVELGMADHVVDSSTEFLSIVGLEEAEIVVSTLTVGERMARLLTNPFVAPILLTLGITGLILEVMSAGFGVFGIIGIISLALFFLGNIAAGFSNWIVILVFLTGLILMAIELVAPGFGVFGIAGLVFFIASIVLVSPSVEVAMTSLTIAIISSILITIIAFRFLKKSPLWNRLILKRYGKPEDKEMERKSSEEVVGLEGVTLTKLRPSGTMRLDSGENVSVVSEGAFIDAKQKVKIIKKEGNRVVVREM